MSVSSMHHWGCVKMQDVRQSRQLTAAQMASTPLRDLAPHQAFPTPPTINRYTSTVSLLTLTNSVFSSCPCHAENHKPSGSCIIIKWLRTGCTQH